MGHLKKCKQASVDDWCVLRPKRRGGVQACCSAKKGSQSASDGSISSLIPRFLSGKTVNLFLLQLSFCHLLWGFFFQTRISLLCVIWALVTLNNQKAIVVRVSNLLSEQHTWIGFFSHVHLNGIYSRIIN